MNGIRALNKALRETLKGDAYLSNTFGVGSIIVGSKITPAKYPHIWSPGMTSVTRDDTKTTQGQLVNTTIEVWTDNTGSTIILDSACDTIVELLNRQLLTLEGDWYVLYSSADGPIVLGDDDDFSGRGVNYTANIRK